MFSKDNCLFFGVDFDPPFALPFSYFMCRPNSEVEWKLWKREISLSFQQMLGWVLLDHESDILLHLMAILFIYTGLSVSTTLETKHFSVNKGYIFNQNRRIEISRTTKYKPHQNIRPPWAKNLICFSNSNDGKLDQTVGRFALNWIDWID